MSCHRGVSCLDTARCMPAPNDGSAPGYSTGIACDNRHIGICARLHALPISCILFSCPPAGGYGLLRLPMRSGSSRRCVSLWRPRGTALEDWKGEAYGVCLAGKPLRSRAPTPQ